MIYVEALFERAERSRITVEMLAPSRRVQVLALIVPLIPQWMGCILYVSLIFSLDACWSDVRSGTLPADNCVGPARPGRHGSQAVQPVRHQQVGVYRVGVTVRGGRLPADCSGGNFQNNCAALSPQRVVTARVEPPMLEGMEDCCRKRLNLQQTAESNSGAA